MRIIHTSHAVYGSKTTAIYTIKGVLTSSRFNGILSEESVKHMLASLRSRAKPIAEARRPS